MWNKLSKIVIIGAGPSGLSLSYQLWVMGFKNITLVEKRKTYTREQIVFVDSNSQNLGIPEKVIKKLFNRGACYSNSSEFLAEPICFTLSKESKQLFPIIVKLNSLEKEMMKYLKNKVKIVIGKNIILDNKSVNVDNSKIMYDILIGADGSNSAVRKKWFKTIPVNIYPENEYSGAIVFFKPSKKLTKKFMVNNLDEDIRVTRPRFPRQQSRSRIFILQDSTIMLSLMLTNSKEDINNLIHDTFVLYGVDPKIMKYQTGEIIKFPLKFHKSNEYIKKNSAKKVVALIGDAAFNTHFFSGSGLNLGITLATLLAISPEKYNKLATDLQKYAEYLIKRNLINLKKLKKECKEYTHKQLVEKLASKIKKENVNHFSNDELCLYLENILLSEDYIKSLRYQPPTINSIRYFSDLIVKDFCAGKNTELKKKYNKLFDLLLNAEQKFINRELTIWKSYVTDFNPKSEPKKDTKDPTNNVNYNVWLAHKDFKTKNPYKMAEKQIKKAPSFKKFVLCMLLQKFKKKPIFDNFLNLYIML